MKIAINGAGVAGTALAYWLLEAGHDVLLVEQAPQPRQGGYLIDFWGGGYDIADKMGLIPRLRAQGYQMQEVRYVDERGRAQGGFSIEVFDRITQGRFTSLRRSDLAATLYAAVSDRVQSRFGDSIAAIDDRGKRVRIAFDRSAPCDVDLVVGADGLHSRVRKARLRQGRGRRGDSRLPRRRVRGRRLPAARRAGIGQPCRARQADLPDHAARRQDPLLLVFRDEYLPARKPSNDEEGKAALRHVFGNVGWEVPGILAAMDGAHDLYFDRVSQIRMNRWTSGRVAVLANAAACGLFWPRRDGPGDHGGVRAGRRTASVRRRSPRRLRQVSGTHASVPAKQAEGRGRIRVLLRPKDGPRHPLPESRDPPVPDSFRARLFHRPGLRDDVVLPDYPLTALHSHDAVAGRGADRDRRGANTGDCPRGRTTTRTLLAKNICPNI